MPHKSDDPKSLDTKIRHNDWRDDLFKHGYVVVKGVIGPTKAQQYMESMFAWLEKFPLGFDRNNRSTWTVDHLPAHMRGGMYHGYSVQHEDFVWEARMEPGVVDAFAKLWGTDELLVSFDGINFTLPGRDRQPTTPWPHIDQSPRRKGLVCAQGIINFAPNGPDDGGLVVVRNSHNLTEQFFNEHPEVVGRKTWGPEDWFGFEEQEVQWFLGKGCDIVKVCADPGDLIIWDSRTIHYNAMPTTDQVRSIVYACYAPANWATEEDLTLKTQCFQQRRGTTHLPSMNVYSPDPDNLRLGVPDPYARDTPFSNVKETEPILRMAGVLPYQRSKSKP